ncbi:williams-beuren syndrome critical region protein [Dorcoceras hygrometricum]|uniref:Williams-beuren syndrome critical region protein n=1 Tax=Dorcoceras hygrometricum TaxID=472368 RepID=A0A2Z7AS29_9LAMI|nr:williams-beuren syndrome critical region protein [Dorcoceras hygrometricum]
MRKTPEMNPNNLKRCKQIFVKQKSATLTAESFSSVHSRITVLCSTADSTDVKVADPPVVSTAGLDFCLQQLIACN